MNCKPGDLAIIVRCDSDPLNVGMLVNVISYHRGMFRAPDKWKWDATEEGGWLVKSCGGMFMDAGIRRKYVCIDDCRLRPINPPAIDQTTEADELVKA